MLKQVKTDASLLRFSFACFNTNQAIDICLTALSFAYNRKNGMNNLYSINKEALMKELHDFGVHEDANLFSFIDEETLQNLAHDIKMNGQNETVKIFEGKIIDGRNRYMACLIAGVEPKLETITTDNPFEYSIGINLHRRHLNTTQRAWSAAQIVHATKTSKCEAKDLMNVSLRSLNSAIAVQKNGVEALQRKVEAGVIAISTAEKISHLSKDKQNIIAKLPKAKIAKMLKGQTTNDEKEVRTDDMVEVTISFTKEEIKQIDLCSKRRNIGGRKALIHDATVECSINWLPPSKEQLGEMFSSKPKFLKKNYKTTEMIPDKTGSSKQERDMAKEMEHFEENVLSGSMSMPAEAVANAFDSYLESLVR